MKTSGIALLTDAMSQRKTMVHESERNPHMLMQTWMMNMLLEKSKKMLSESERLVCNRITTEQKLLCKRHRRKLHESKIIFARITRKSHALPYFCALTACHFRDTYAPQLTVDSTCKGRALSFASEIAKHAHIKVLLGIGNGSLFL